MLVPTFAGIHGMAKGTSLCDTEVTGVDTASGNIPYPRPCLGIEATDKPGGPYKPTYRDKFTPIDLGGP